MVASVTLAALSIACSAGSAADGTVAVGREMPSYSAVTLSGDSAALTDYRGKAVLLNVWATWCHPCRDEIPALVELRSRFGDRGFEIVGVSIDAAGADAAVRGFMSEFAMTYPVWRDPDDRITARYMLFGVPTTFLLDREGVLRWRHTGPVRASDTTLLNAIERALGG